MQLRILIIILYFITSTVRGQVVEELVMAFTDSELMIDDASLAEDMLRLEKKIISDKEKAESTINLLEKDKQQLEKEVNKLQKDVNFYKQGYETEKDNNDKLSKRLEDLQKNHTDLFNESVKLIGKHNDLLENHSYLFEQNKKLRQRNLNEKKKDLEKINELIVENTQLVKDKKKLLVEIEKAKAEVLKYSKEVEILKGEKEKLDVALDLVTNMLSNSENNNKKKTITIDSLQRLHDLSEESIEKLRRAYSIEKLEKKRIEDILKSKEKGIKLLKIMQNELQEENKRIKRENTELKEKNKKLKYVLGNTYDLMVEECTKIYVIIEGILADITKQDPSKLKAEVYKGRGKNKGNDAFCETCYVSDVKLKDPTVYLDFFEIIHDTISKTVLDERIKIRLFRNDEKSNSFRFYYETRNPASDSPKHMQKLIAIDLKDTFKRKFGRKNRKKIKYVLSYHEGRDIIAEGFLIHKNMK